MNQPLSILKVLNCLKSLHEMAQVVCILHAFRIIPSLECVLTKMPSYVYTYVDMPKLF